MTRRKNSNKYCSSDYAFIYLHLDASSDIKLVYQFKNFSPRNYSYPRTIPKTKPAETLDTRGRIDT
jgi:hypothetical protein